MNFAHLPIPDLEKPTLLAAGAFRVETLAVRRLIESKQYPR
jgi:hypothetical protein